MRIFRMLAVVLCAIMFSGCNMAMYWIFEHDYDWGKVNSGKKAAEFEAKGFDPEMAKYLAYLWYKERKKSHRPGIRYKDDGDAKAYTELAEYTLYNKLLEDGSK